MRSLNLFETLGSSFLLTVVAVNHWSLSTLTYLPIFFSLCILLHNIFILLDAYSESRAAQRVGAKVIPTVRGVDGRGWIPGADIHQYITYMYGLRKMQPGRASEEMKKKHGKVVQFKVGGNSVVFTFEPDPLQRVLATNFENYGKEPMFMDGLQDFLGTGVFNSDQKSLWSFHRKLTRPHFSKEEVNDMEHFKEHTERLIAALEHVSKAGEAVDVQELFGRLAVDVGTDALFGVCSNSLTAGESYTPAQERNNRFIEAFQEAQKLSVKRFDRGPLWRLFEWQGSALTPVMNVITEYFEDIISAAKEESLHGSRTEEKKKNLLQHLLQETNDHQIIRDEILNIFIALRDTSTSVMTSIIYNFARNPSTFAKARQEVLTHLGSSAASLDYESFKNCRYLRAVIHEALRLHPPVFGNSRYAFGDDVWVIDGQRYYVKGGSTIRYPIGCLQRNEDYWGPDARVWDPERWIDERVSRMTSKPFIFQAFSAGPRICLGQKFALNEISYAVARMLQTFESVDFAWDKQPSDSVLPDGQIKEFLTLTIAFRGGMWVRFKKGERD